MQQPTTMSGQPASLLCMTLNDYVPDMLSSNNTPLNEDDHSSNDGYFNSSYHHYQMPLIKSNICGTCMPVTEQCKFTQASPPVKFNDFNDNNTMRRI